MFIFFAFFSPKTKEFGLNINKFLRLKLKKQPTKTIKLRPN